MAFYMQQGEQVERDAKLYDKVPSVAANLKTLQGESLTYNMDAFATSWNNMLAALGDQGIPAKIAVLRNFTSVFTDWTKGIREGEPRITAAPMRRDPTEGLFVTDLPMLWVYRFLREHGWFSDRSGAGAAPPQSPAGVSPAPGVTGGGVGPRADRGSASNPLFAIIVPPAHAMNPLRRRARLPIRCTSPYRHKPHLVPCCRSTSSTARILPTA
ncbi:MAG: hypothetical protein ACREF3_18165 [Acetobacteraceae bacterium]